MLARFGFFLLIFLSCTFCLAQSTLEQRLNQLDSILNYPSEFDRGISLAEEIAYEAKKDEDWESFFAAYYNIAYVWEVRRKLARFLDYEKEIKPLLNKDKVGALEMMILFGNGYRQNGQLLVADNYYKKAIERIEKDFPSEVNGEIHLGASINRGVLLAQFGDFIEARTSYQYVLQIIQNNLIGLEEAGARNVFLNYQSYVYSNIGQTYLVEEKGELCIQFFEKSLEVKKQIVSSTLGRLNRNHLNLAIAHLNFGEPGKAQEYIQLILNEEGFSLEKGRAFRFLAELKLREGELTQSHQALDSAKVYYDQFPERKDYVGRLWQLRGQTFLEGGNQPQEAIAAFQKALEYFLWNYHPESLDDIPQNLNLENGRFVFESLQGMGQAWKSAYSSMKEDGKKELAQAITCYEVAIQLMDTLRMELKSRNAKFFWGETLHETLEEAIELCCAYNTAFGEKAYLDKAYEFSNAGKAFHLKESLMEDFLYRLEKTQSKELLYEQSLLEERLAGLHKAQLLMQLSGEASQKDMDSLDTKVYNLRKELLATQESLQAQNPQIKEIFSSSLNISSREIQSNLREGEIILDYFWGKKNVFSFVLDKDRIGLGMTATAPFQDLLDDFFTYLRDPEWVRNKGFTHDGRFDFANASNRLYSILVSEDMSKNSRLIIVPDGPINHVPFSALISDMPTKLDDFAAYPFLLKACEISYAYGQFGRSELESSRKKISYMGFAPSYQTDQSAVSAFRGPSAIPFAPLKYNQEEVEYVQTLLGGEKYVGQKADLQTFIEKSHQASLLHLALHGFVNDSLAGLSGLVFAGNPEDNTLIASEIPSLSINADLVVLSACETGLGKFQRGEGVLSLARSFREAGAKGVLMTQWSIDDRATAGLIQEFFRHYNEGEKASSALRTAQMDYLQSYDKNHPYYWSGLVLVGEAKHKTKQASNFWVLMLGLAISLALGATFFMKKKHAV